MFGACGRITDAEQYMGTEVQDAVCAFVREIIEARTGESIRVTDRPEVDQRSGKVVEERWESASYRYAVEHTRLESYTTGRSGMRLGWAV
jgi:hypothetical protein